jgi:predicted short-subunit dehydrogenase-like oxidoreductase (DUF2520 family)
MASERKPSVGFIGAGRAATSLAVALASAGYQVIAVASRSVESAQRLANRIPECRAFATGHKVADAAQLVFITTPDDGIEKVTASVYWQQGHQVAHCSGALGLEALWPASAQGAEVGSFHPIQTFGPTEGPLTGLDGVMVGLEAQGGLFETLKTMITDIKGTPLAVPAESRALYHAAATMSCGHLAALLQSAVALWERAGLPADLGRQALQHLAKATLESVKERDAGSALTGPLVRGDLETVERHLTALKNQAPELLPVYTSLGQQVVELSVASGRLPEEKAEESRKILSATEA